MKRGSNVALTREVPSLTTITVGVRYDAGSEPALADNLVVATLLCDEQSKVLSNEHFVFFNQLSSPDETVVQTEQALGSDAEQVLINLPAVPAEIARIVLLLYVNDGLGLRRSLGQLRSCDVRVVNAADSKELVRSEDLVPALTGDNAAILAEIYRHAGDWKFKVVGDGYTKGIAAVFADYGVSL